MPQQDKRGDSDDLASGSREVLAAVAGLREAVEALSGSVRAVDGRLAGLERSVAALENAVTAIDGAVAGQAARIERLDSEADAGALRDSVVAIEGRLAGLAASSAKVETSMSELQGAMETVNVTLAVQSERLERLDADSDVARTLRGDYGPPPRFALQPKHGSIRGVEPRPLGRSLLRGDE